MVQLDASCMHGPTQAGRRGGALEGIKTPSEVARLVLKYTNHIMLVGEGAKQFALSYGFKDENLLTPESRQLWLTWRANRGPSDDYLDVPATTTRVRAPARDHQLDVVNAAGDLISVTTTSGLAWKIPGRVGDSPIVGAGQYTDNDIGAAGSTGRGIQHHGLWRVPDGRAHAARDGPDRRLPGDAPAGDGDDAAAAPASKTAGRVSGSTSTP